MIRILPGALAGVLTFVILEFAGSAAATAMSWGIWVVVVAIALAVGFKLARVRR